VNELDPTSDPLIQLSEAFDSIGHPMYSDEFLGRVMAFACLSEFCEATVLNHALNSVLQLAARRFKMQGGCVPTAEGLQAWITATCELGATGAKTPWLAGLMKRYRIDDGWQKIPYAEHFKQFANTPLFRPYIKGKKQPELDFTTRI